MPSMEQMDRQMHDSCKAMFETVMAFMIDKVQQGDMEGANKDRKVLLQNYSSAMDSCANLLSTVRALEKTRG